MSLVQRIKLNCFLDVLPDSWLDEDAILNGNLTSISAKVTLDLNDPFLLVDIRQPNEIRRTRRIGGEFKRRVNKDLTQRYNISNDEAYDLLKENHQNKVRSTIGQLSIEHSMPALRLQSPYVSSHLQKLPYLGITHTTTSIKLNSQSKKPAPSIAPVFTSMSIKKSASPKSRPARRRPIAAKISKLFSTPPKISLSWTAATLSFSSTPKNTPLSCPTSAWEVASSTTTAAKAPTTNHVQSTTSVRLRYSCRKTDHHFGISELWTLEKQCRRYITG